MKKNIVIIVLSTIILGLGGYLVYDKVIDKNEKKIEKEEVQEEKFDEESARTLVDEYFSLFYNNYETITEFSEQDKLTMALKTMKNELKLEDKNKVYEIVKCSDIPGAKLLNEGTETFGFCYIEDTSINNYVFHPETVSFTYNDLNKTYKKLFGEENNAPKKSTAPINYAYYDLSTDKYYIVDTDTCAGGIYSHCAAGPTSIEWNIKSAIVKNDILTIEMEVVNNNKMDTYRWIFKYENYRFVLQTINLL